MIGSLRGTLLDRTPWRDHGVEVLVDVGGVGYRVVVPVGAVGQLSELGAGVFLHIHTHVREDAIVLYGFPTRDERACFEALIGAHGVGPAVALALLGVHSPAALRRAVADDDTDALRQVPGIGLKTAQRLLVELKSRLEAEEPFGGLDGAGGTGLAGGSGGVGGPAGPAAVRHDLRAALVSLGYSAEEIRRVVAALPADGALEDLVRLALRELASAR